MKELTLNEFISVISEDPPALCFFYKKEDRLTEINKHLKALQKKAPLLNIYKMDIDINEEVANFCELIEIPKTPVLMVFKDGNFSRYKNKRMNQKEIEGFVGSLKKYQKKEEINE